MNFGDLGDILYLLLIVAFGIIGTIGKSKKKNVSSTDVSNPNKKPTFWEELQKEMKETVIPSDPYPRYEEEEMVDFDKEVEEDNQKPIIASQMESLSSYSFTDEDLKRESVEYSDTDKDSYKDQIGISEMIEEEVYDFDLQLDNIDQVKKAIIYAEIFERKYT